MGSAWYVLGLAFGRVRRRGGGTLAAALGIAAAAAVLAGILAGATVAKDRGVAQDVDRLSASARAVRAVWFGVPAGGEERWRALDRSAREALEPLPAGEPTAVALVRESTVGRHVRRARGRRRARAPRVAPVRPPAADVHRRAL